MEKFKYVATCSKLLETYGFDNKEAADEWVKEANARAGSKAVDCETSAYVMTWEEWEDICEYNEVSTDVEAGRE